MGRLSCCTTKNADMDIALRAQEVANQVVSQGHPLRTPQERKSGLPKSVKRQSTSRNQPPTVAGPSNSRPSRQGREAPPHQQQRHRAELENFNPPRSSGGSTNIDSSIQSFARSQSIREIQLDLGDPIRSSTPTAQKPQGEASSSANPQSPTPKPKKRGSSKKDRSSVSSTGSAPQQPIPGRGTGVTSRGVINNYKTPENTLRQATLRTHPAEPDSITKSPPTQSNDSQPTFSLWKPSHPQINTAQAAQAASGPIPLTARPNRSQPSRRATVPRPRTNNATSAGPSQIAQRRDEQLRDIEYETDVGASSINSSV
ncbi:hypothetical protein CC80DRAFT_590114 [Byssothecium circinans]|uniref:Uncharacterized protein n=1 Tax=Byssothecium circinans TaxID=147558 RepID=A0A6A5U7U6_9PLEO|nr:hypothetical protein CC80DRAFT_590114 [Byssothecium circinans]